MPKAYPEKIGRVFKILKDIPRKIMSCPYDSVEHIVESVGYTTEYLDGHFVIRPAGKDQDLDTVVDLAYAGKAALFGEPETSCRGYPWAIEDYMCEIQRRRILMIKDDVDEDQLIDDGWEELEEWRNRPLEPSHATSRPPVNFAVNLKDIAEMVEEGKWPECRYSQHPDGHYCTLLYAPERRNRALLPLYQAAKKALRDYNPEGFMEEANCCWNSHYRAGGDWCPPISLADGNFFYRVVRKGLITQRPKKPAPKKEETESEDSEEEEEFHDLDDDTDFGADFPSQPKDTAAKGARPKEPKGDPINRALGELGYTGKHKATLYNMVTKGRLALKDVKPRAKMPPKQPQNQRKAEAPEGDKKVPPRAKIQFADFPATKKLNQLSAAGEFDRVQKALTTPRMEWIQAPVKITEKITDLKRFMRKNPDGQFSDVLQHIKSTCRGEKVYMKVLGNLYGIMEIDVESNAYSERRAADPLGSDSDY